MGLHICAYILKERVTDEWSGQSYWEVETFENFDSIRRSGDKEFVTTGELEWIEKLDNPKGTTLSDIGHNYIRPENLDLAKRWVMRNVYEGNQKRLLDLLEEMRKDNRLFIYCAW